MNILHVKCWKLLEEVKFQTIRNLIKQVFSGHDLQFLVISKGGVTRHVIWRVRETRCRNIKLQTWHTLCPDEPCEKEPTRDGSFWKWVGGTTITKMLFHEIKLFIASTWQQWTQFNRLWSRWPKQSHFVG